MGYYSGIDNAIESSMDKIINHDGDTWSILSTGTTRDDGKTYCHLASTTRSRQQRNGPNPIQMGDWVDLRDPITAFYSDRANGCHAAKAP